jgi:hypothetical protein
MTTEVAPIVLSFDLDDANYLASQLSAQQLRREIHHADAKRSVSQCFGEDDAINYWQTFSRVCELALDIQKANQPKVVAREGQFSVKAIKETHDIVDVISRYTKLRKAGKEHIGSCPFHSDNNPSVQVNQEKQLFFCFSCQHKGDVINFLVQIENLDTKQACLFLRRC